MTAYKVKVNGCNRILKVDETGRLLRANISGFVTAAQIEQVLEQAKERLAKVCGVYNWSLVQTWSKKTGRITGYIVVANWKKDTWIEGRGKTPMEAVNDWNGFRLAHQEAGE